jgi:hypothetical protein
VKRQGSPAPGSKLQAILTIQLACLKITYPAEINTSSTLRYPHTAALSSPYLRSSQDRGRQDEAREPIFVIGDTASLADVGSTLPGVAPVAMQQGRYVAQIIRARTAGDTAETAFAYFDKGMLATIGRTYAIAHIGRLRLKGVVAWGAWMAVHIAYLIGSATDCWFCFSGPGLTSRRSVGLA